MTNGTGTQNEPGFSRAIVDAVIAIVARDPASVARISGWTQDPDSSGPRNSSKLSDFIPTQLGWTGSVRNLLYIVTGEDASDPEIAAHACTGIAEATSAAINRAIDPKNRSKNRPDADRLEVVRRAATIDRVSPVVGVYHTATLVITKEGGAAVFDWHATLEVENPMISKVSDWRTCTGEIPAKQFKGW